MNNNNIFSFSDKVTSIRIGIFNNKGGVAKTTSVINIAHVLHKNNIKVLVVDCDTQENCFSFFTSSITNDNILPTNFENIKHTTWERYKLMTGNKSDFQIILFDLPPTLSDEVRTIISHMDIVYVPTMIGEFEISGLKKVTDEILRQNTKLGGIFITKYQNETDSELIGQLREALQDRMLNAIIPFSNTVRKSQMEGLPLEAYFDKHKVPCIGNAWKVVNAYNDLTCEIVKEIMSMTYLKELKENGK